MNNRAGIIFGKVVLSIIFAIVGILLGAIFGEILGTKMLGFLFVSTLLFPIWYPSSLQSRTIATVIGPVTALGVWYAGRLAITLGPGNAIIALSAAISTAGFAVGLGVEYLIMRRPKRSPELLPEPSADNRHDNQPTSAHENDALQSSATPQTDAAASNGIGKFLANGFMLLIICFVVGWVLSVVEIDALGFIRFVSQSFRGLIDLLGDAVRWGLPYILLGAVVVVPIFMIKLGVDFFRRRRR